MLKVAILGSGNIATDLMIKIHRTSSLLDVAVMAGIDAASEGLARASRLGVATTHAGIDGLIRRPEFEDVAIVFDATSAAAHPGHDALLQRHGKHVVDLTPAAIGPFVVPAVNFDDLSGASNVNMVTCGGQATVPTVAAISRVAPVSYAEIVASIASRSAGPGTRANIDEFTRTTARAIERVGGAKIGKAIIVLNPADPPLVMRNTVFCLVQEGDPKAMESGIERMADAVRAYVPGFRLKQAVQFEEVSPGRPARLVDAHGVTVLTRGLKVSVFLEIEGAGHYLPRYAGNLDIMTSAALRTGEKIAGTMAVGRAPARAAMA
jgi:acetaldehyde dehydrogenase